MNVPYAKLKEADFLITSECESTCGYCYVKGVAAGCHSIHSFERAMHLIAPARPELHLSGGEPLLHPDLLDFVRIGTAHGLRVQIQTNGLHITKGLCKRLAAASNGSASFMVTINTTSDGLYGDSQTWRHRSRQIKSVLESGLHLRINTVVMNSSIDNALELLNRTVEWHVNMHTFARFTPIGSGDAIRHEYVGDHSWLDFCARLRHFANSGRPNFHMRILAEAGLVPENSEYAVLTAACPGRNGEILTVLPDQTVAHCPLLIHAGGSAQSDVLSPCLATAIKRTVGVERQSDVIGCPARDRLVLSAQEPVAHMDYCCILRKLDVRTGEFASGSM